jgi:hypothetical protein
VSKLRVNAFPTSVDGYGARSHQDEQNPLGRGGLALHQWLPATPTFQCVPSLS